MIRYSNNKSSLQDIENHLFRCNKNFVPKLESYVNISEYSKKIFEKAIRFECFKNSVLIGLMAAYKKEKLYITNVSTDPNFLKKGIGSTLMDMGESFCKLNNLKYIQLEVGPQNKKAINFYKKRGFEIKSIGLESWGKEIRYEKKL